MRGFIVVGNVIFFDLGAGHTNVFHLRNLTSYCTFKIHMRTLLNVYYTFIKSLNMKIILA